MPPIVSGTSNLIYDPHTSTGYPPDSKLARGVLRVCTGILANLATDLSGSKYHLADLPSDCILQPGTFFDVENDGFAQIVIGTEDDTDALIDQTKATENVITPIANGDTNHGVMLWQVLGLSADPGGKIALWKHAEANAAAAGSMKFAIHYLDD